MAIAHITPQPSPAPPSTTSSSAWMPSTTHRRHAHCQRRRRRCRPRPRPQRQRRRQPPALQHIHQQPATKVAAAHHTTKERSSSQSSPSSSLSSSSLWQLLLLRCALAAVCCAMLPPVVLADCPRQCECKWKSGKESVQCLKANLTGLPPFLDAGTQILDLTGNEITAIRADVFTNANLLNLQKLFVAKCRIRTIDRFGFRKIKNLVELDLSWNVLQAVPTHAFDSTPELRDLKLTGNPIQVLEASAFGNVPQLVRLELTDCRLQSIERGAFDGLEHSLEWLKIDGNRLATVHSTTFTVLRNLHNLELAGNPWNCSCALRSLRQWMLREKIPYEIPPVCQQPDRLAARSWDKIELDDFACVPRIGPAHDIVHAVEGDNVTITCRVIAEPEPYVQWWLRSRLLANLSGDVQLAVTQGRKVYMARWWPDESNLTIVHADMQDAGVYNCTAANNAGHTEASVTVHMTRRPPEAIVGMRVLLTSIAAAVVLVVASVLIVVFFCSTAGKGVKLLRWKKRRRTESCENIEMTFNSDGKRLDNGAGPKPYGENGISVVGQTQKNRYRSVPSDDEGSLYEESAGVQGSGALAAPSIGAAAAAAAAAATSAARQPDVHVPRLIDFCDQIPTSANASLDGCPFDPNKSEYSSPSKTPILLYTKPNWTQQQQKLQQQQQQHHHQHHQKHHPQAVDLNNTSNDSVYSSFDRRNSSHRASAAKLANNCDTDSTYPDLLDISSLSLNSKLRVNTQAVAAALPVAHGALSPTGHSSAAAADLPFSTYPRQKPSPARTKSAALAAAAAAAHFSDSQSLLLAGSNAHLLSNLSISMKHQHHQSTSHQHHPKQRHTVYQHITALSPSAATPDDNHIAISSAAALLDFGQHHHKVAAAAAAVAGLINNNPAGSVLDSPSSPGATNSSTAASSIIATAQAYDYHAAQLERFLEEYRNLQQQLCRMKETCDSIRQKEAPGHRLADRSAIGVQSAAQAADPAMYSDFRDAITASSAAAAAASHSGLPLDEAGSPNHKVLMRKSTANPRQPPDPPPYWLHRTAILKRLQAPTGGGGVTSPMATAAGSAATAAMTTANNGNDVKEFFRPQS